MGGGGEGGNFPVPLPKGTQLKKKNAVNIDSQILSQCRILPF